MFRFANRLILQTYIDHNQQQCFNVCSRSFMYFVLHMIIRWRWNPFIINSILLSQFIMALLPFRYIEISRILAEFKVWNKINIFLQMIAYERCFILHWPLWIGLGLGLGFGSSASLSSPVIVGPSPQLLQILSTFLFYSCFIIRRMNQKQHLT